MELSLLMKLKKKCLFGCYILNTRFNKIFILVRVDLSVYEVI